MREASISEQAALGSMLIEPRLAKAGVLALRADMFTNGMRANIYLALKAIVGRGREPDAVSVVECLRAWQDAGKISAGRGPECAEAIKTLLDSVATTGHFEYYLAEVRRAYYRRRIEETAAEVAKAPSEELLSQLHELAIRHGAEEAVEFTSLKTDLPGVLEDYEAGPKDAQLLAGRAFLDTGFKDLDARLNGLLRGNIMTVGARPGGGKSALMMQLALSWALKGARVFAFTTEMLASEVIVHRLIPHMTGIPAWKFRRRRLDMVDHSRIRDVLSPLHGSVDLMIQGRRRPTINDIRAAVYKLKPDVVVVDYLQRVVLPQGEDNRAYRVEAFMEGLKDLALDAQVVVVLGAQLKRETDYSSGPPQMADLRDSSAVEHQSDAVVLLHNVTKRDDEPICNIEAWVRKNRGGIVGMAPLLFRKELVDFTEQDQREGHFS